ncbi:hypothetical protein [Vibrio phage JSF12]|uniref:DUF7390 domain-containing protein n=2 Tax=Jesfedecavirus TaxID=2560156 RepID=A0A2D0Z6G4_9CAUD|nr:hypothetical protein FDI98_gp027 [Vibrio phage JSF10]YP_009794758.1 hypothetical protein HOS35_gp075 [Vibrio phage JSF12]ASV43505.1 hypothetical protein [Vibrio phage JSF10]ASV43593.1 hypothetical protein [Vibrio phage JSF12]
MNEIKDTLKYQADAVVEFARALGFNYSITGYAHPVWAHNSRPVFTKTQGNIDGSFNHEYLVTFNSMVNVYNFNMFTNNRNVASALAPRIRSMLGIAEVNKIFLSDENIMYALTHSRKIREAKVKWSSKQHKYVVDCHLVALNHMSKFYDMNLEELEAYLSKAKDVVSVSL